MGATSAIIGEIRTGSCGNSLRGGAHENAFILTSELQEVSHFAVLGDLNFAEGLRVECERSFPLMVRVGLIQTQDHRRRAIEAEGEKAPVQREASAFIQSLRRLPLLVRFDERPERSQRDERGRGHEREFISSRGVHHHRPRRLDRLLFGIRRHRFEVEQPLRQSAILFAECDQRGEGIAPGNADRISRAVRQ